MPTHANPLQLKAISWAFWFPVFLIFLRCNLYAQMCKTTLKNFLNIVKFFITIPGAYKAKIIWVNFIVSSRILYKNERVRTRSNAFWTRPQNLDWAGRRTGLSVRSPNCLNFEPDFWSSPRKSGSDFGSGRDFASPTNGINNPPSVESSPKQKFKSMMVQRWNTDIARGYIVVTYYSLQFWLNTEGR